MFIRRFIPVLIIFAGSVADISSQDLCPKNILPGSVPIKGWYQVENPECFTGDSLFDAIDGGAEIQLEFGFVSMARASYSYKKRRLNVEVYCMTRPEAAYGIMTTMNEGPPFNPVDGSYSVIKKYYGMLVKGRYFVVVIDQSGKGDLISEINKIIENISARITESVFTPEIISTIGKEGIIKAVMFSGDIVLSNYCYLGVARPFQYEQGVYIETSEGHKVIFLCKEDAISDTLITSTFRRFEESGKYTADLKKLTLTNSKGVTYKVEIISNRIVLSTAGKQ